MNKSELIASVYGACENDIASKAAAERIVNCVFDTITDSVRKGESVSLSDFGSFTVVQRAERTGVNPQTKESIKIPAKKAVKFSPYSLLKEAAK